MQILNHHIMKIVSQNWMNSKAMIEDEIVNAVFCQKYSLFKIHIA